MADMAEEAGPTSLPVKCVGGEGRKIRLFFRPEIIESFKVCQIWLDKLQAIRFDYFSRVHDNKPSIISATRSMNRIISIIGNKVS